MFTVQQYNDVPTTRAEREGGHQVTAINTAQSSGSQKRLGGGGGGVWQLNMYND